MNLKFMRLSRVKILLRIVILRAALGLKRTDLRGIKIDFSRRMRRRLKGVSVRLNGIFFWSTTFSEIERDDEWRAPARWDSAMIAGLVFAALVAFAAGFTLHVAALSIFALVTSMVYLALTYESSATLASVASALTLFAVMQFAYVIGVLISFPFLDKGEPRWLAFLKLRGRTDSSQDKSR